MCNDYRLIVDIASVAEDIDDLQIKIRMPGGTPNVEARDDIRIGAAAQRRTGGTGIFEAKRRGEHAKHAGKKLRDGRFARSAPSQIPPSSGDGDAPDGGLPGAAADPDRSG